MLFSKPTVSTNEGRIAELLSRNIEEIFVKDNLLKRLSSGQRLRVKLGFDPTGDKIHIGRAIILRKLRDFQALGHQIVFIVGDFTARIGDPSDKLEKRPMLSERQIKTNLKNYKEQIGKIIDLSKAEFHYNSRWLSKLGFAEIGSLAESFSVQQMSGRRNFKERFERGEEVSLREFMYPLMQGYDSVAVKADVEIGGFDQLFNLKAGRVIQRHYGLPEQDILTTQMLPGTDGRKMSTSWGNVINITDSPDEMFGKTMSVQDDLIVTYFKLCTDRSLSQISDLDDKLKNGLNPRDVKLDLAEEIVSIYHGKPRALLAKEEFLIVEKQRNQQRVIIKANRENKSFLQLKRIYNIYHLYTRGFVEYLINQYGKPECIILFGSYAKGEDVESSDIDIAIITTRNEKNLALEKYEKQTARKIKIKELIKAKIEKEFWNTLANGIILYGYLEVNS